MTSQGEGFAPIEIEAWLNGKASWLRAAAHDLIKQRRMPDEAGIDVLAEHCLQEAAKALSKDSALLVPGAIAGTPEEWCQGQRLKISAFQGCLGRQK